MNARKETLGEQEALELARRATDIYAARGKSVTHVNVQRDEPDDATLKKMLLGPTGNLRAPVLRKGKTLLVGFNEHLYRQVFQ